MKVRAKTTGVYVPAGHFNLREGEVYDVNDDLADVLVSAGVATPVKESRKGKKLNAAPENKAVDGDSEQTEGEPDDAADFDDE